MNPENTFTPTPQMSLATANSLPSGSFIVNKLDFYQPQIDMPNTLDLDNSAAPDTDIIDQIVSQGSKKIAGMPYNKFSDMSNPIKTSLAQTMRYQDSDLGGYRVDDPNQEYRYGNDQGFLGSVGARAMQFAGNFGASFFGSFNDIPSIIQAGKNYYDSDNNGMNRAMDAYRGLYDNAGANYLDEFNKSIMDSNFTYDTRFTEAHPMSKIFGDIFSSSGFALGSMIGMLAEDAGIAFMTGGTAVAPVLAGQIAKVGAKFIKILNSGDAAINTLTTAIKGGVKAEKAIDLAYTASKIQKAAFGINMYTNNIYEASTEAKQAQEAQENKLTQEYINKHGEAPTGNELVQIKQAANSTANWTLFGNMALLAATNKFEFGDVIKRMQVGKEAFDLGEKGFVKLGLEGGIDNITAAKKVVAEVVEPTTKLGNILNKARKFGDDFGGYTRSSLGELVEEGGQFTVSTASEDYFKQKYNAKGLDSANTWYKSLGKALGETVSTTEGWMNMLAGLGGGIVMGAGRKALGLDPDSPDVDPKKIVDQMTTTQLSGIVYNMGAKINEHINAVGNKAKGDEVQDWYGHQTTQHNQVFNWAIAALKGRNNYFAIREEQIKTAKELEGADFKSMFGVEDNEENRTRVHGYLDAVMDDARTVKKNFDRVNAVYKNPYGYTKDPKLEDIEDYRKYENYKDELVYHLSKQAHNQKAMAGLDQQIKDILPDVGVDDITNHASLNGLLLTDKEDLFNPQFVNKKGKQEGIVKVREQYLEKQKELEGMVSTGIASKEDIKQKEKLDNLIKTMDESIAEWETNPDVRGKLLNEVYEYDFDGIDHKKLNPTDITELLALGAERAKMKASYERSFGLYQALASKDGFKKFRDLEMAAGNRFLQQQAVEQESTSDADEVDQEIIDDETYRVFVRAGQQLPKDKKQEILEHIAAKIKNNIALTEREKKVYGKYKTDIDALNKAVDVPEEVTKEPEDKGPVEPVVEPITKLKEGDILKSVATKEELLIKKITDKNVILVKKSNGESVIWNMNKFQMVVGAEQYTLTGEINTTYTKEDVAALHRKYDHKFLFDFGDAHGGARYITQNEDSDTVGEQAVVPTDFNKADSRTGEAVKPIVLTRRGIKALIHYDKTGDIDDTLEAPWIYAGRERDPSDKRSIADILKQYQVNAEEAQMDLTVALKEVINSPYATDSEVELARYIIQYIPIGTKVNITADKTYYQESTKSINIGIDAIADSPIEVILVHETLHLLTIAGLKDKAFVAKIQELYDIAKKSLPKGQFRGIEEDTKGNVHLAEFITEALTNQAFMKALAGVKYKKASNENLWKTFIDAVQKLFKINSNDTLLNYISDVIFSEIDTINTRNVDTGNSVGMLFNPATTFSRILTRGVKVNPKLISLRNEGNFNTEYIVAHGQFKVDVTRDADGNPSQLDQGWEKYKYPDRKGQWVKFDNLFKRPPTRVIEVHIDGVNVGIIQPISTWSFQRNGGFLPLTELTQDEYVAVTHNLPNTYDHFMQTISTHAQLENALLAKTDGEMIKMSSMSNNFDLSTSIGPLAIVANESKRFTVKSLEDSFPTFEKKKQPFIISLSKAYDPATNSWIDRPVGYLTGIPLESKVGKLIVGTVEKNMNKLKGMNARYLTVVSTTGKWESEDDIEFIISHPNQVTDVQKTNIMDRIRLEISKNQEEGVSIDGVYIIDPSTGKREIELRVKKGALYLVSKFANIDKKDYSKPIYLADMDKIKDFDGFIKLLNERIDGKSIFPINARDFKTDIADDATVDPNVLSEQLLAVTAPAIRNSVLSITGKINFVNPRANAAESIGNDNSGSIQSEADSIVKTLTDLLNPANAKDKNALMFLFDDIKSGKFVIETGNPSYAIMNRLQAAGFNLNLTQEAKGQLSLNLLKLGYLITNNKAYIDQLSVFEKNLAKLNEVKPANNAEQQINNLAVGDMMIISSTYKYRIIENRVNEIVGIRINEDGTQGGKASFLKDVLIERLGLNKITIEKTQPAPEIKPTEQPKLEPKVPQSIDDIDLDELNSYEEGDGGEDVEITPEAPAPVAPTDFSAKSQAKGAVKSNGRAGKKLSYQLATPTQAEVDLYKRTCGS